MGLSRQKLQHTQTIMATLSQMQHTNTTGTPHAQYGTTTPSAVLLDSLHPAISTHMRIRIVAQRQATIQMWVCVWVWVWVCAREGVCVANYWLKNPSCPWLYCG